MGKPTKRNRKLRDKEPVIYCLEGVWRHDDNQDLRSHDGSVEPMLRFLDVNQYWPYRHRDVATFPELEYYLINEWWRCKYGSVLYIATHGSPSAISLSTGEDVSLDQMAILLEDKCEECHVHFGGCAVVSDEDERVWEFKRKTGAAIVSGFRTDGIGWSDMDLPAALAELMLFSALSGVNFADGRSYKPRLKKIKEAMKERFDDCDFQFVI